MVFSLRKNSELKKRHINVQEVYNLWDLVAAKYSEIDQIQIWENFAHDLEAPPNVLAAIETTEMQDDDYMFRILNAGIQGAAVLHSSAVKQCTTNDRLRKIFANLLSQEIDLADKLTRFGKLKSWFNEAPQYILLR